MTSIQVKLPGTSRLRERQGLARAGEKEFVGERGPAKTQTNPRGTRKYITPLSANVIFHQLQT